MKDFGRIRIRLGKKASLSLSINAIVVLILAITMLGLGLAFMKGLFKKTTGQLEEVSASIRDQIIEDIRRSGSKLTFDKEDIRVKRGESQDIYFGVKNVLDDPPEGIQFEISPLCDDSLVPADPASELKLTAFEKTRLITNGEIDVQKMIIKSEPEATLTTFSCLLNIINPNAPGNVYAKKSFFVTVE